MKQAGNDEGRKIKGADIDNVRERTDIVRLIKFVAEEIRQPVQGLALFTGGLRLRGSRQGCFHCFGCKAGGPLNFVMKLEGLSFPEAVERLADRIGYQLSILKDLATRSRHGRGRLLKMNQLAAECYHHMLLRNESGIYIRTISRRGFEKMWVQRYAPASWEGLTGFLKGKGYTEDEMVTIGLSARRKQKTGVFDIFRDRVIFPIADRRGKVVAFGGRSLPDSGEDARTSGPKYLNSPETPVDRKRSTLYGYYQSPDLTGEAIVVEGTPASTLWQAGSRCGHRLNRHRNHFALLGRHCDRVYLCLTRTPQCQATRRRWGLRALPFRGVRDHTQGTTGRCGAGWKALRFRQKRLSSLGIPSGGLCGVALNIRESNAMAACLPVLKKVATLTSFWQEQGSPPYIRPSSSSERRLIVPAPLAEKGTSVGQADGGAMIARRWGKVENEP